MSTKMKNEAGEEIEVLTPEEIEAQEKAAVGAREKELTDKFNSEKKALEDKMKHFEGQNLNFENIRKAKEEAEKDLKEFKETNEREKAEAVAKDLSNYKTQLFEALAGKDPELKKKIEFHFTELKESDTSDKTKIDELANKAMKIAVDVGGGGVNRNAFGSGSGGIAPGGKGVPANLVPHAKAMGMSEEEFSKYYQKAKEQGRIKE